MSGNIRKNRIMIHQSVNGTGIISGVYSGIISQSGLLPRIRRIF